MHVWTRAGSLVPPAFALIAATFLLAALALVYSADVAAEPTAREKAAASRTVLRQLDRHGAISARGVGRGHWLVRFRGGALRRLRKNATSTRRWQIRRPAGWKSFPPRARGAGRKPRDRTAPTVSWNAPTSGSTVTALSEANCQVTATDNVAVSHVEFSLDGRAVDREQIAPYHCALDLTGVAAGRHVLAARAVDASGNAASRSVEIVLPATAEPVEPTESTSGNWVLTFSDEFAGVGLDRSKWGTGWGASFSTLTHFLDEQLLVSDGRLRIVAERQSTPSGRPYAGGLIQTRSQFGQRYGRFEARMKVPAGRALWPAFWMMPSTGEWPPEIDVMEMVGQSPTKVYQTNHWKTATGTKLAAQCIHTASTDLSQGYHTYSLDWSPGLMIWMVDGVETCRRTSNVDHGAMYLIVDLAVGSHDGLASDWVGLPDSTTQFPEYLDVDWVRAYRAG